MDAATRAALAKMLHEPTMLLEGDGRDAAGRAPRRGAAHPLRPVGQRWADGIVAAMGTVRLATRGSPLALRQTEIGRRRCCAGAHPGLEVEPVVVRTRGDRDADVAARPASAARASS